MTSTTETDTSVVVIGAGQAGLSVAYYLRRLGLDPGNDFVLLDRGPGTGGAWQHRWEALRIGSAHRINDLPGLDELGLSFETADRHMPAKKVVADYYRAYEDHYDFKVVRNADVVAVDNFGEHLNVTFTLDGEETKTVSTMLVKCDWHVGRAFYSLVPGAQIVRGPPLAHERVPQCPRIHRPERCRCRGRHFCHRLPA